MRVITRTADQVRDLRRALSLTQKEFAARLWLQLTCLGSSITLCVECFTELQLCAAEILLERQVLDRQEKS